MCTVVYLDQLAEQLNIYEREYLSEHFKDEERDISILIQTTEEMKTFNIKHWNSLFKMLTNTQPVNLLQLIHITSVDKTRICE